MKIYKVTDREFLPFGKVLHIDTKDIIKKAQEIPLPKEGSSYVPAVEEFEELPLFDYVKNEIFGTIDTQLGYCFGHNDTLNALEWHKCPELNIAVTDFILLLGDVRDIEEDGRYNSQNLVAFKVEKGCAIEIYATTLHFCPIQASKEGFGCVVGLLRGTNTPHDGEISDKLQFRKNKWIIAHEENTALINKGVACGIYGENYKISEE